jgi:FKBP-type peptidyl-prolyl cis-trans isomerase SlyD
MMAIDNNMVVSLEYELRDKATSDIIDSNVGESALEFITGRNHIIPGLEKELLALNEGDSAQVIVAPAEAYGEFDESAVQQVPVEQFAGIDLQEGMPLYAQAEDGSTIQVIVKTVTPTEVTVDYNHPLAGKELLFDIKVLAVREPTAEESLSGQIARPDSGGCCGGGGHDHGHEHGGGGCGCGH